MLHTIPSIITLTSSYDNALVAITTFAMLEQRLYWPDVPVLEKDRLQSKIEHVELSQLLKQYCQVAYVSPLRPTAMSPTEIIYEQVTAMGAGIASNTPVINGYSGFAPPGFSLDWDQPEKITAWLQAQKSLNIDRLCFIRRKGANAAIKAGTEGLERHQSKHYSLEVMHYP